MSLLSTACGGGGGGGNRAKQVNNTPPPVTASSDFDLGIFRSPSLYKDSCATPRGAGFADTQGSTEDENDWLRAWSHNLYLWYDEIVDEDPSLYTTPDFFDLMKTFALTPTGTPKDQFHFTYDTAVWEQLAQSGVSAGYGAEFVLISAAPPREVVVAYVESGYPAEAAGLTRGTQIIEVDGVDVINGFSQSDVNTLNAGLFPSSAGETHTFVIEDSNGANRRSVTISSAQITQDPVPISQIIDTPSGPAGYLLFNSLIAPAESSLVSEISAFETAGITNLILDLRYNGGGFLDIANELAFMIAGPAAASGRIFDETQFNDKHPLTNPVTGQALTPDTFHTTTQGFSIAAGTPLPSLNLNRVYILAGPGTCSASETIINGLRGIDIEVILIGKPTCGKPYGFYPTDNCGTTYFSIQFRGVNAKGFGNYTDGFVPTQTPMSEDEVQGCPVADDFSNPLGDNNEARLATAVEYIATNACRAVPVAGNSRQAKSISLNRSGAGLTKPIKIPGMVKTR